MLNLVMDITNNIAKGLIIENAGNTCYIDSLLMALYYNVSIIDQQLVADVTDDVNVIYLQEVLRSSFVNQVRNGENVTKDVMEMIVQLCAYCGWKPNEIYQQQDVSEFYTFLIQRFNVVQIETKRETTTEAIPDQSDDGQIDNIPFIPLSPTVDGCTLNRLLDEWMYNNITSGMRSKIINGRMVRIETQLLNTYRIMNMPKIMAFCINRFTGAGRNKTLVDIPKKISPFKAKDFCHYEFHAVVCHTGDSILNGHYYSVIKTVNETGERKYFLFDDQLIPSLSEIDMAHRDISERVKRECYLLIYRLMV